MSASASSNSNTASSMSEADDANMFQAARRTGRRNALGDLEEQLAQVNTSTSSSEVDNMAPNFEMMSIKH